MTLSPHDICTNYQINQLKHNYDIVPYELLSAHLCYTTIVKDSNKYFILPFVSYTYLKKRERKLNQG